MKHKKRKHKKNKLIRIEVVHAFISKMFVDIRRMLTEKEILNNQISNNAN